MAENYALFGGERVGERVGEGMMAALMAVLTKSGAKSFMHLK